MFAGQPSAITSQITSQGELSAQQRIGIYRHSVHGILRQHLRAVYPVCEQLVGTAFFSRFCAEYFTAYPPDNRRLACYGAQLAELMQVHEAFQGRRWIAEIAGLEWARHHAWHSTQWPLSAFAELAELDAAQQAQVCFRLPQSATLLASAYALTAVWQAHQAGPEVSEATWSAIRLQQAEQILVWRQGRHICQQILSVEMHAFLQSIREGKVLAALAQEFQDRLPALLTEAVQNGFLAGFELPSGVAPDGG
ncbi:MAG: DNA-binding domain-containing protein, partial [Thiolinea sp.]